MPSTTAPRPAKRQRRAEPAADGAALPPGPQTEPLVPIRLDLSLDGGRRVQETFMWNLRESSIAPQAFAAHLALDLGLPDSAREPIAEAMQEQIAAFVPPAPRSEAECRHVVRLAVRVGRIVVRDQFEWDLQAPENNPEAYAERLCIDIGLGTEHVPAVAHAVREQLVELAEFRDKRQPCPVLREGDVVRDVAQVGAWEPAIECLSVEEQERLERKEKREARLMRRNRGKAEVYSRPSARRRSSDTSARRRSSSGF